MPCSMSDRMAGCALNGANFNIGYVQIDVSLSDSLSYQEQLNLYQHITIHSQDIPRRYCLLHTDTPLQLLQVIKPLRGFKVDLKLDSIIRPNRSRQVMKSL